MQQRISNDDFGDCPPDHLLMPFGIHLPQQQTPPPQEIDYPNYTHNTTMNAAMNSNADGQSNAFHIPQPSFAEHMQQKRPSVLMKGASLEGFRLSSGSFSNSILSELLREVTRESEMLDVKQVLEGPLLGSEADGSGVVGGNYSTNTTNNNDDNALQSEALLQSTPSNIIMSIDIPDEHLHEEELAAAAATTPITTSTNMTQHQQKWAELRQQSINASGLPPTSASTYQSSQAAKSKESKKVESRKSISRVAAAYSPAPPLDYGYAGNYAAGSSSSPMPGAGGAAGSGVSGDRSWRSNPQNANAAATYSHTNTAAHEDEVAPRLMKRLQDLLAEDKVSTYLTDREPILEISPEKIEQASEIVASTSDGTADAGLLVHSLVIPHSEYQNMSLFTSYCGGAHMFLQREMDLEKEGLALFRRGVSVTAHEPEPSFFNVEFCWTRTEKLVVTAVHLCANRQEALCLLLSYDPSDGTLPSNVLKWGVQYPDDIHDGTLSDQHGGGGGVGGGGGGGETSNSSVNSWSTGIYSSDELPLSRLGGAGPSRPSHGSHPIPNMFMKTGKQQPQPQQHQSDILHPMRQVSFTVKIVNPSLGPKGVINLRITKREDVVEESGDSDNSFLREKAFADLQEIVRQYTEITSDEMDAEKPPSAMVKDNVYWSTSENPIEDGTGGKRGGHNAGGVGGGSLTLAEMLDDDPQVADSLAEILSETIMRKSSSSVNRLQAITALGSTIATKSWFDSIMNHEQEILKNKRNACELCGFIFQKKHDLKRHIDVVHYNRKEFKCVLCSAQFGRESNLRRHCKTVHGSDKPYTCVRCRAPFSIKRRYEEHMETCGWPRN